MNRLLIAAALVFCFFAPVAARAGIAVVDRVSGRVVDVCDEGGLYGYDLSLYELVPADVKGVGAESLKYDNGAIREMTAREKELRDKAREGDWRSDYDALYIRIRNDLARDGLAGNGAKS